MARIYNVQQGRSKVVTFSGIKELQQRVNQLKDRAMSQQTMDVMAEAALILKDQAEMNLQAVNAPHEVREDLFVYGRNRSALVQAEKNVTALAGLRKKGGSIRSAGYVEWYANRQQGAFEKTSRSRRKRARLNIGGTKIGENLGTMWELGTSKMAPRPWWRPAVQASRARVFESMAYGLRKLIGDQAP